MTILSVLQDPVNKGGVATAVSWYRRWMQQYEPTYSEIFLDEHGPSGLYNLLKWTGVDPAIPRVLPRLHIPQYWCAARRVHRSGIATSRDIHVVGASVAQGAVVSSRISMVWFATLFDDERRNSMSGRSSSRRLLYSATLAPLSKLERRVLGDADRVLAMSHHTAELVAERGLAPASAITVVPVPVDTAHYEPPPRGSPRRGVLFVGRAHDPRKGFARLIALAQASRLVRDRGVTVVSPGPSPSPLPDGMLWQGRVEDLAATYQRHEILVLPSRQEGLGIVAFEAMACGTPVVAWRCGGPDRFIQQSGGGLLVNDSLEMQRVVEDLLGDSGRCQELGQAGRKYVERTFSSTHFLNDPNLFAHR